MSFELPRPDQRTSVDVNSPITIAEGIDYRVETQLLADEIVDTTTAMTMRAGEPLPGDYIVVIAPNTATPLFNVYIPSPEDIKELLLDDGEDYDSLEDFDDDEDDEDDDESEQTAPTRLQIKLVPLEGSESGRGDITFDNDDVTMRMTVNGPKQTITVRDIEFVVRHRQSLRMWNYNLYKKSQGHPEEHFPGNRWDPEYHEAVIIDEGQYAGQDLTVLLREFEEAIEELQSDPLEVMVNKTSGTDWDQFKRIYKQVEAEITAATGYSLHTSLGVNALQEMRELLTSIRQLVS